MIRLVYALAVGLSLAGEAASEPDAANGAMVYRAFCAVCHGQDAKGDGVFAPALLIAPPDLTRLAANNGGVFPVFEVVARIDGRDPVLAHGGEMPLFGEAFVEQGAAIRAETGQPIFTYQAIADVTQWLIEVQE